MTAEDNFRLKSNMSAMDPSTFWKVVEDRRPTFNTCLIHLQINNGDDTFSDVAQYALTLLLLIGAGQT